ncbi:hypothetical protein HXX76_005943 [Chlamydomonas incerta]|uniref:Uncharacterized protein n=1 Tax=Chlamydomonas incerta TaxID=51695 RepID=A0A835TBF3_CHLIN|nr:hypothetical protein HXX76_005943 [Chlamydomonas incerta]|eukprot:KAG2437284.1 hypothetical protein HXX76_005943 [Chlamydomonas incerta]
MLANDEGARLRPPPGNSVAYPREFLQQVCGAVSKAWSTGRNAIKRDVALTLLADPDLRLRVCHLEEILRVRQQARHAQGQANGQTGQPNGTSTPPNGASAAAGAVACASCGKELPPPVQLQSALAEPGFAALFELDPCVTEPDWGMQVLWLNMAALVRELGLPQPPQPAPPAGGAATQPATPHSRAPQPGGGTSPGPQASAEGGMTGAELSAVLAAVEAAFPAHPSDDDEYLTVAACYCLTTRRDPRGLLPPHSLHLTDLAAHLRGCAVADNRLAALLQRFAAAAAAPASGGAAAVGLAARLGELLAAPRARLIFRQSESLSRKGERVVSLALEQLLRVAPALSANNGGAKLPVDAWQRSATLGAAAAAAAAVSGPGGAGQGPHGAGNGDGLPSFLFEYESGGGGGADGRAAPGGGGDAGAAGPMASRSASSGGAPSLPTPQQSMQLQHSWSDNGRGAANLHSAASMPVPLPGGGNASAANSNGSGSATIAQAAAAALARRNTEPHSEGLSSITVGSGAGGLGFGSSWSGGGMHGGGGGGGAEGISPSSSFNGGGPRFPQLFNRSSSGYTSNNNNNNHNNNNTANNDALFQQALAVAAAGGNAAAAVMASTLAAAARDGMAASPGGPSGDMMVPPEIADVWSNSAAADAAARDMVRRPSLTAAGLDGAGGGVFAMSPTNESYLWERMARQQQQQQLAASQPAGANGPGNSLASANAGLGYSLSGLGYSSSPAANGFGGQGLMVGSAPMHYQHLHQHHQQQQHHHHQQQQQQQQQGLQQPFMPNGISNGFNGLGGLVDYSSWHSSSPDLGSSFGRRPTAAEDNAAAANAWMVAHSNAAAAAAAANAAAAQGGANRLIAAAAGAGGEPAPSVSEESEEVASVGAGPLELDHMAMTLEAIIGYDPSNPRGATGGHKGLIAAAAGGDASAFASAAAAVASAAGGGAPANGDSSRNSSLDSGDALHARDVTAAAATLAAAGGNSSAANAAAAAMLTSWSAMAARNASLPPPSPHSAGATSIQQLAAAMASPGGAAGRLAVGSAPMPHDAGSIMAQGLAATVAAMGAAAAARQGATVGSLGALGALPGSVPGTGGGTLTGRDLFGGRALHPKLTPRVRDEICTLIRTVPGLRPEDFDDGVLHQLTLKKSEEEAVGALRMLAAENVSGIQHMAAYINHVIKNYHLTGPGGPGGVAGLVGAGASLPSATVRANSTPVSSKAILQKLPLRVYKRLEDVIAKCSYMEWKHFDAGVVKVMAQLAEIGEEDVFEELELLQSTDLSNVEYMPAYLNKRLNNRLWSRRKMLTSAAAASGLAASMGL